MHIDTKLPKVGTTIFTVMSQLALEHSAVNLGQGFPDDPGPRAILEKAAEATFFDDLKLLLTPEQEGEAQEGDKIGEGEREGVRRKT